MGFLRQEYWSGLPFPFPGNLPDPWIEPRSLTLWANSLPSEPPAKPIKVKWALRVEHWFNRFSFFMKPNTREFSVSLCLFLYLSSPPTTLCEDSGKFNLPSKLSSLKVQSWHVCSSHSIFSHMAKALYKCHSFSLEDPLSFTSWRPWHLSDLSKDHFHKTAFHDSDTAQFSLICGHKAFCAFPFRHVS